MSQTQNLPTGSDIPVSSITPWRIADGKLCQGSTNRGTYVEHPVGRILGYVKRFSIENGIGDDGKPWKQLEVDLETGSGFERVKVNYNCDNNIWPTQGIGLAKALASIEPDWAVVIEPQRSAKPNDYGKYTTFVQVDRWLENTQRRGQIQTEWDGEKFRDIVDDVFEALCKHPLYKNRERSQAESELSEYQLFETNLESLGWPLYHGNETAWLKVINEWLSSESADQVAALDPDSDEDYWTYAREKLADCKSNPLAKKGPPSKSKPVDEDPFKNE